MRWLAALVVGLVVVAGGWVGYTRIRPPCPDEAPLGAAQGDPNAAPRELTPEERTAAEAVARADQRVADIADGQPYLAASVSPASLAGTGQTAATVHLSWPSPTTAPASLFVPSPPDRKGRFSNVTRVMATVDLETRAVVLIHPGPGAKGHGLRRVRPAHCSAPEA